MLALTIIVVLLILIEIIWCPRFDYTKDGYLILWVNKLVKSVKIRKVAFIQRMR